MGNDDPTFSPVKSKNSETPSNKPNEAENSLKPNSTSPTSDPTFFTPRTPLSSTRNENSKLNKLLLRVAENKFKNSRLECENLKTNLILNRNELLNPSNPTEKWRGKSKKSATSLRRTKRT